MRETARKEEKTSSSGSLRDVLQEGPRGQCGRPAPCLVQAEGSLDPFLLLPGKRRSPTPQTEAVASSQTAMGHLWGPLCSGVLGVLGSETLVRSSVAVECQTQTYAEA